MRFSFRTGIYLVLATTIAMLITIGGAYQLSVTEQTEQSKSETRSQLILTKLEELVSAREAVESAALKYVVSPKESDMQRLRQADASCRSGIAQLAEYVADDPEQLRRAAALDAAAIAAAGLQQEVARVRRQRGMAAAVAFISSDAYRQSEREFEQLIAAMRQQEHAQHSAHREHVAARMKQLGQLTLWSGLLTVALALFAAAVINRQREERRLAEANLREQEKQYRLVTDSVPAMIGYVDRRHRLLLHNRVLEEWFDLPAERIASRHLAEIMGNDAYMAILPGIERALREADRVRGRGLRKRREQARTRRHVHSG